MSKKKGGMLGRSLPTQISSPFLTQNFHSNFQNFRGDLLSNCWVLGVFAQSIGARGTEAAKPTCFVCEEGKERGEEG